MIPIQILTLSDKICSHFISSLHHFIRSLQDSCFVDPSSVKTMEYSDKVLGFVLLTTSLFIFVYYSAWVLLLVSQQ